MSINIPSKMYLSTLSDDGERWTDYECQVVSHFAHDYRKYVLTLKDVASDTEILVFWPGKIDHQGRFVYDPYRPALQTWKRSLLDVLEQFDCVIKPIKPASPHNPMKDGLE